MDSTPQKSKQSANNTSSGIEFTPYKDTSSSTDNHSEQVDEIAQRIKKELEGRESLLSVSQLCSLLGIPQISQPEHTWPSQLFGNANVDKEEYDQEEAVRLLNHIWGVAQEDGFQSVGSTVFTNAGSGKRSEEKPDIVLLRQPGIKNWASWENVLVVGEVKRKKTMGHLQLCRYLRKLHQNRPGGSSYVGFLVAGRRLSVFVSNAAGLLKTLPIDLTVQDSFPLLADCLQIFRHVEHLYVPPFEGYLECPDQQHRSYHFTSSKLVFVKETMQGSRTAVWSGSLQNDPAILKSCWLPHHLINHEGELIALVSAKHSWGIIPFVTSGVRLIRDDVQEATPHDNKELIRYREVSISWDNGYRAFDLHAKATKDWDWITILAGISDTARILYLVWSRCRVHHRDISTGNIVFAPRPATDSDFCLNVEKFLSTKDTYIATQPERKPMACLIDWANGRTHSTGRGGKPMETPLEDAISGTRPFLSIQMLDIANRNSQVGQHIQNMGEPLTKEQKYHLPIDDLESLYWVLLWFAAYGNDDALQPWRCSKGGLQEKGYFIDGKENVKKIVLAKFMEKWDSKSPLARPIFALLLDLSKTIKKLRKTFGRLGELENDTTHSIYEANLVEADAKWAPLFFEFVQRLDKTVSDLCDKL